MTAYPPPRPSPPPRPRERTTGLWAAGTFLVLTLACLALLLLAVSGGRLPDLGAAEVSWTPPPDAGGETPLASAPRPPDGIRLAPGTAVQNVNTGPVNLRRSPGFQNKPANDVIVAVPAGQLGVVLAGPQESDGLLWWQVRFGSNDGWMAERSSRGVLLLDAAP